MKFLIHNIAFVSVLLLQHLVFAGAIQLQKIQPAVTEPALVPHQPTVDPIGTTNITTTKDPNITTTTTPPPTTTIKPTTTKPPPTPPPTTPPTTPTTTPKTTPQPPTPPPPPTTPSTPSTAKPTSAPTAKPEPDRKFDGPSFIGGMILTMGLMAIAFVSWKFYKARTERNYHTL